MKQKSKAVKVFGLTGGIGSGKSLVAELFREFGLNVLSADTFSRELTQKGSPVLEQIARDLGAEALAPDGSLQRRWLREKITQDPSTRKRLEAILHPAIQKRAREEIERLEKAGVEVVIYEIPLLFEVKSSLELAGAIGVASSLEQRVARVVARDKVSAEDARAMIAIQMDADKKLERCDFVIQNSGSLAELRDEVKRAQNWISSTAPIL